MMKHKNEMGSKVDITMPHTEYWNEPAIEPKQVRVWNRHTEDFEITMCNIKTAARVVNYLAWLESEKARINRNKPGNAEVFFWWNERLGANVFTLGVDADYPTGPLSKVKHLQDDINKKEAYEIRKKQVLREIELAAFGIIDNQENGDKDV